MLVFMSEINELFQANFDAPQLEQIQVINFEKLDLTKLLSKFIVLDEKKIIIDE